MTGFQIHTGLLNDFGAYKMSHKEFVQKFYAAAKGEENELSKFVKPWNGRPPKAEWSATRSRIFERDDYTCQYCGERGGRLECDHVVPVARGGNSLDENLKTACRDCNRSKRAKMLSEWKCA